MMKPEIQFILVEPKLPENVGACARAIHTMGFSKLKLVNPCDHLCDRARWVAHGSKHILEAADVYKDLSEAVASVDWVVGTSAKLRHSKKEYIEAKRLPGLIQSKQDQLKNVGVVFGREDKGLFTEELALCDLLTGIPLETPYPSLNLSHAVMVYAYELSGLGGEKGFVEGGHGSESESLRHLKELLKRVLSDTQMKNDDVYYQRVMERVSLLGHRDIGLMHFFLKHLTGKL